MKYKTLIIIFTLSLISVALTLFAPLGKSEIGGLFKTRVITYNLYEGVCSPFLIVMTTSLGLCFIVLACIPLFKEQVSSNNHKWYMAVGIAFIIMQVACIVKSMNPYGGDSISDYFMNEISVLCIHPAAIVSIVFSILAVILGSKQVPKS